MFQILADGESLSGEEVDMKDRHRGAAPALVPRRAANANLPLHVLRARLGSRADFTSRPDCERWLALPSPAKRGPRGRRLRGGLAPHLLASWIRRIFACVPAQSSTTHSASTDCTVKQGRQHKAIVGLSILIIVIICLCLFSTARIYSRWRSCQAPHSTWLWQELSCARSYE